MCIRDSINFLKELSREAYLNTYNFRNIKSSNDILYFIATKKNLDSIGIFDIKTKEIKWASEIGEKIIGDIPIVNGKYLCIVDKKRNLHIYQKNK